MVIDDNRGISTDGQSYTDCSREAINLWLSGNWSSLSNDGAIMPGSHHYIATVR